MLSTSRVLIAMLALTTARAQVPATAPLPAAPQPALSPAPGKPLFVLPPEASTLPSGPVPDRPAPFCMGSTDGAFTRETRIVPNEFRGPMQAYLHAIYSEIFSGWSEHMTRSEKDLWSRGRMTAVRLLIRPDGSYDRPEITVSAGKSAYDKRALDAIEVNAAFPPPPGHRTTPVALCLYIGFNLNVRPVNDQQWLDTAEKRTP